MSTPGLYRLKESPSILRGALWAILGGLFFTLGAITLKAIGTDMPSLQLAFLRGLIGLALILPLTARHGIGAFISRRPKLVLLRGLVGAAGFACAAYVLPRLPLADATAIFFASPLFIVLLAVIFLGETVQLRRALATLIGFAGILIIMRPAGGIEIAMFVALIVAFLRGVVAIMIKKLGEVDRPETIVFYFSLVLTLVLFLPAVYLWQPVEREEWVYLVLTAAAASAGQICLVHAYRESEAGAIAPFSYLQILFAGLGGYLLFAEIPDGWTFVGVTIIVASTAYIARRESQLEKLKLPSAEKQ